MKSESPTALRAEFDRLSQELDRRPVSADRAVLKRDIVALFRRTEGAIEELSTFKESIRELVERFKALPESAEAATAHHDHLGASTYIERGWGELARANWVQAEGMLRHAAQLDATNGTALALLAWALIHQGRLDEALPLCLQVLVREPEHGLARVGIGLSCLRRGILGEAIEHLTRAAHPRNDQRAILYANYWLGVALLERNLLGDAQARLREAVTLGPNLAEGWAELGRVLWHLDRLEEAREAWAIGAGLRHSPYASQSARFLEMVSAGGTPPRSALR